MNQGNTTKHTEQEKKSSRKKIIKIIIISLIILFAGFITIHILPFLAFVAIILYNILCIPAKPNVEHGEFPFELVYEYKGEQITITDTIVCDYDGYSFSLEGGNSRDWVCSFKDNEEYVYYVDIENEPDLYIVVPEAPEYYMEDGISKEYADPYIRYTDEDTGTYYEEKEKIDIVDIKIIEWRPSEPLKDNFK